MLGYWLPLLALCAGEVGIANGGFDQGLDGWASERGPASMAAENVDGRTAARMAVPAEAEPGFPTLYQEWPAEEGDVIEASVEIRTAGVSGGHGAYLAVEFRTAENERITYAQTNGVRGDSGWREQSIRAVAPPETKTARLVLLLNGRGEAWFDNARAERTGNLRAKPLDGPVTLTVTNEVVCDDFLGFGFEDDGWFYNPENAARGVTEEDHAIREGRLEWMDPDRVRMFFWIEDWCPSGDWGNFTFDSPNMLSHYRTLDLYQRIGTEVNVTGVEWGVEKPYADPPRAARAIGELLEHLVRDRGYTCVKHWTLTNEPNWSWRQHNDSFEAYVEMHRLVREELQRRNLDIAIVGSDDTSGFEWFKRCVENEAYFEAVDTFASHRYSPFSDRLLAPYFFEERMELLKSKTPVKPLTIDEFGFQDARSGTVDNPLMRGYPYAVWTAAFAIEGLNRGVAGFCIWSVHEMYYPGGALMEYALWDFKDKDNNWKVRPVYHAWANFCRLTERGEKVLRCASSSEPHVIGVLVGQTLFWVNRSDQSVEVRLENAGARETFVFEESTLQGDRECGVRVPDPEAFTAPPQSFGYALVEP